ncbi:Ribosomal RNA small subunit methyltransferase E [Caloramator mitchellensis]|uniref:Ribosomal RNA small subunit methyltransferase E n=1 Tax=Caloramator mitchellensis TaxID=908809 RepID=A0A0R3K1A6_CALMK|nr:16S rRNA (uracil(1498)-N(3))-methyltransferase [Caloramator mitchellensis]KRQ86658.1 Ribosomal RNA small subunit methyltransferase E [Caloramator mitchellensis]
MHKFFVKSNNINGNKINIEGEDVNHILKVLRLRKGEKIQVSDGEGNEYICEIDANDKKTVYCNVLESYRNETEPPLKITLFQGMPKAQKMDLIVQKCVEIGVVEIVPVITKRVVVKTEDRDISNKIERWNRISYEAAKQSDRGIVPKVLNPISFEETIERLKNMDLSIVPYENEEGNGIKSLTSRNDVKNVGILIGPEGGFEEEEIEICKVNGIIPVTLGPRILRTETAGFVASALILYEFGDLGGAR